MVWEVRRLRSTPAAADVSRTAGTGLSPTRLILLLASITALGSLSIDMYLPAFPRIGRDLGASPTEVQLTLTGFMVGLALGQLIIGPLSDALGRRRPLLTGLCIYAGASLACAVAPSAAVLVDLRFLQGLGGAAGLVIARAVVRDTYTGADAARAFSLISLTLGVAPVAGPVLGAGLVHVASWRLVFLLLGGYGVLAILVIARGLPETLAFAERRRGGARGTLRDLGVLLGNRHYVGHLLVVGLTGAALFTYIGGSSFVLQDVYGLSTLQYGLVFGINAVGLIGAGRLTGLLVGRVSPRRLLVTGLATAAVGAVVLLAAALLHAGVLGVVAGLFLIVAPLGLITPNGIALSLDPHGARAGAASALIGLTQFSFGAAVAPLVGVLGTGSALPLACVIAACELGAIAAYVLVARRATALAVGSPV